MKLQNRWISPFVVAACVAVTALSSQSYEDMKKANADKLAAMRDQNEAMMAKLRAEINGMREEIKQKGLNFQVEINDKMKEKMKDITGLKPPKPPKPPKPEPEPAPAPVPPVPNEDPRSKCDPNADSFDWRAHGIVPPVRDQKACGDCYLFAAMGAYESAYLIQTRQSVDIAEQYFLNCTQQFGCDGGFYGTVWETMRKKTPDTETSYPYQAKKGMCKNLAPSGNYLVKDMGYAQNTKPTVQAIKNALCAHGVLATSVNSTRMFSAYKSGVFNENANTAQTNHAINIVRLG